MSRSLGGAPMPVLLSEVEERHATLADLLSRAVDYQVIPSRPGEARENTDRFLAQASRHVAATARVLLPAARRHLRTGRAEVRDFVRQLRRLERSLLRAKAKQYGEASIAHEPWHPIWASVRTQLTHTLAAERRLIAMLADQLGPDDQRLLRERFVRAVPVAQTRPHPCLPHTGPGGYLARLVCSRFDAVWDELEGRVTSLAPSPAGAAADRPASIAPRSQVTQ